MTIKFLPPKTIQKSVDCLLESHHLKPECPMDVENIASEHLGFKIMFRDLQAMWGTGTLGMIMPKEALLFCDSSLEPLGMDKETKERIARFTIAHELGHFCLHKEYVSHWRSEFFYTLSPKKQKDMETQADMFAAMLLMPEALFKEKYFNFQTTKGRLDNQESKRLLSEAFNVSKEAASNRMKTLGLA
jgi:hypothetical protein